MRKRKGMERKRHIQRSPLSKRVPPTSAGREQKNKKGRFNERNVPKATTGSAGRAPVRGGSADLTRLLIFEPEQTGIIKAPRHSIGVLLGGAVEAAIDPLSAETEATEEELGGNIAFTHDADNLRTVLTESIGELMKQEGADAGAAFRFDNGAAEEADGVPAGFIDDIADNFTVTFGDQRSALLEVETEFKILTRPGKFKRGAFNIENGVKVAFRDFATREGRVDRGKGGIESKKVVIIHK